MTTAITDPTTTRLSLSTPGTSGSPSPLGEPIRAKLKANAGVQLTLLTNEGDVVTISGRSSLRVKYGEYDRHGRYADDGNTTTFRASFKQQLSLSVQGSLSDQELADIDHLLGTIADVFNQAMTALPEEVAGSGLSLGTLDGLDSISAVTGSMTYSSKLSATYLVPGSPSASADDDPSSETGDGVGAPAVPSVADALIRVKSTYQVSQQIALYRLVTEHAPTLDATAPVPETTNGALMPTTSSADNGTPMSDTTATPSTTSPSAAPVTTSTPVVAGAPPPTAAPTTASTPVGAETPASPATTVAQAATEQIVAAIGTARSMTSGLFDTIAEFLDALVGQVGDQAGADSVSLYLAQSIRIRVVQHLSVQPPAETPASVTEGEPSSTTAEPTTAPPSSDPVDSASA